MPSDHSKTSRFQFRLSTLLWVSFSICCFFAGTHCNLGNTTTGRNESFNRPDLSNTSFVLNELRSEIARLKTIESELLDGNIPADGKRSDEERLESIREEISLWENRTSEYTKHNNR